MSAKGTKFWKAGIGIALLIVGCVAIHQYLNRPFETANRFVQFMRDGRFSEAKAMIDERDQQKIPAGYWEQFQGQQIDFLASPNLPAMLNNRLSIKPTILNHQAPFMEIRYDVYGRRIRVADIHGQAPE